MIRRYLRAFIGAIRMTLSGETPPPSPLAPLRAWMQHTTTQVNTLLTICVKIGLDDSVRRKTILVIEGRRTNLNTVLMAVKFHAQQEYPMVLMTPDGRSLGALYATNVNDCFLLGRCIDILPLTDAKIAMQGLKSHLEAIPTLQNEMSIDRL